MGGVASFSGSGAAVFSSWLVGATAILGLEGVACSLSLVGASSLLLVGASSLLLVVAAATSCLGGAALVFAAFIPCPCSACVELLPGFWG